MCTKVFGGLIKTMERRVILEYKSISQLLKERYIFMKKIVIHFISWLLSLPAWAYVTSSPELTSQQVKLYLGAKTIVLCEIAGQGVTTQIQLDGNKSEWVVWYLYLGKARGAQKVLKATATPLEGMNFKTEFSLELERETKINLTLNTQAKGSGTIILNSKLYSLESCRSKF